MESNYVAYRGIKHMIDALGITKYIIIQGPTGVGKTTMAIFYKNAFLESVVIADDGLMPMNIDVSKHYVFIMEY